MPAAKKKTPPAAPARFVKLIALMRGPGRPYALAFVAVAVLAGGWHLVWREVRQRVLSSPSYLVGPQNVVITPLPSWIHVDIREDVFRNASLDAPQSILDDDLVQRIADAFSLHPWVAKVHRVTKHHPARVSVELTYRRPVCMVEVRGKRYPVDVQGVLLPADHFSPVEAAEFPRLLGVDTLPMGTIGEYWGDVRVVDGAEIADALSPVWEEFELSYIKPSERVDAGISREEHTYVVLTRGGSRVAWGRAPSADAPGELSADAKVAHFKEYFTRYGSLEGCGAPRERGFQSLRRSPRPRT